MYGNPKTDETSRLLRSGNLLFLAVLTDTYLLQDKTAMQFS